MLTALTHLPPGAYLLGTSSLAGSDDETADEAAEDQTGWRIEPSVGPELQHVQLIYRF